MLTFIADAWHTVAPPEDDRHGPLAPMLLALTVVTGLVDSFSYLVLGHVFVANMTGNVVFFGFALVRAPGFSIAASAVALASFWLGALLAGQVGARLGQQRGTLLATAASIQAGFVGVAVVLAAASGNPVSAGFRYPLIVSLALAMGVQNATARQLAVPDLTTTVLTLTITGIAADRPPAGAAHSSNGRRVLSVTSMALGALLGAVFVLHVAIVLPLVVALVLLMAVATTARLRGTDDAAWVKP
jgi:uncharacterized membrane protein YoaK (UPF0700 family)